MHNTRNCYLRTEEDQVPAAGEKLSTLQFARRAIGQGVRPVLYLKGARQKGADLALSMVYGFVKQSAGHIEIRSEEGHGTTVKIYLPPGTGASLVSEATVVPIIEGGNERILVVEDDKLVRDYVITQLHILGYTTLAAFVVLRARIFTRS
jgi:hypothetical protein